MNEEIEEIHCTPYEGKTAKNEWRNDDFLRTLFGVYKKWGVLFPYFSLTCLKKDTSVKKQKKIMTLFYGWGSSASKLQSHHKEAVYFLQLSS